MRTTIALVLVLIVALLAGCDTEAELSKEDQIYEAVQESVTSLLKYPADAEFPELEDKAITISFLGDNLKEYHEDFQSGAEEGVTITEADAATFLVLELMPIEAWSDLFTDMGVLEQISQQMESMVDYELYSFEGYVDAANAYGTHIRSDITSFIVKDGSGEWLANAYIEEE